MLGNLLGSDFEHKNMLFMNFLLVAYFLNIEYFGGLLHCSFLKVVYILGALVFKHQDFEEFNFL